jgi:hypothetical protein
MGCSKMRRAKWRPLGAEHPPGESQRSRSELTGPIDLGHGRQSSAAEVDRAQRIRAEYQVCARLDRLDGGGTVAVDRDRKTTFVQGQRASFTSMTSRPSSS